MNKLIGRQGVLFARDAHSFERGDDLIEVIRRAQS